jgi:hypothetical protein
MRWLLQWRFLALLLALALLVVVYPLLHRAYETRVIFDALLSTVFLAALLLEFRARRAQVVALALGVPTVVGVWTDYVLPGAPRLPLVIGFHLAAVAFCGFVVAALLRQIVHQKTVTADSIYGAFCGYLLVGLAFSHLYCLLEVVEPGAFAGSATITSGLRDVARRHYLLLYFSFVTLTTVGYGDITPAAGPAQGLAVVEAILGQFYIAGLIAELIGKKVSAAVCDPDRARDAEPGGVSSHA